MADDELTCAVPGERIQELVDALVAICQADAAVAEYARNSV